MLSKMTVKELREVAERMSLTIPSRAKKDEIVAKVQEYIDGWHVIALDQNAAMDLLRKESEKTVVKAPQVKFMTTGERIASYHAVNGSKRLTKRQQRRVAKKFKKAIKRGYDLDVVMA